MSFTRVRRIDIIVLGLEELWGEKRVLMRRRLSALGKRDAGSDAPAKALPFFAKHGKI